MDRRDHPTSLEADGTGDSYDVEVARAVRVPVVANGRAGCPEHLAEAILRGEAEAALTAGIFHLGEYSIRQTRQLMRDRGIPLRL